MLFVVNLVKLVYNSALVVCSKNLRSMGINLCWTQVKLLIWAGIQTLLAGVKLLL